MITLREKLLVKLPAKQDIWRVFSVILFIIFSWTLYRMFWYVPSWLEYLSIWSVLITSAYTLSFALFESAVFLGGLCLLSLLFPRKIFKEKFIAQGSMVVVLLGIGAVLLQRKMKIIYGLTLVELLLYPIAILVVMVILIVALAYIVERFERLSSFINAIAERMTIFIYIYLPLGFVGLVIMIVCNLF